MFGEHVISRAVWLAHVRRRRCVGGARERASRCRRPGFHECLNRRIDQGRASPGSAMLSGGLSSRHTCRSDGSVFIRTGATYFDVYSTRTRALPMFIWHAYLFNASTTDASSDRRANNDRYRSETQSIYFQ